LPLIAPVVAVVHLAGRPAAKWSARCPVRGFAGRSAGLGALISTVGAAVGRSRRETADLDGRKAAERRRGAVPSIVAARKRLLPAARRKQSRLRAGAREEGRGEGSVPDAPRRSAAARNRVITVNLSLFVGLCGPPFHSRPSSPIGTSVGGGADLKDIKEAATFPRTDERRHRRHRRGKCAPASYSSGFALVESSSIEADRLWVYGF